MELESFKLMEYNDSIEHRRIIVELWNDEESRNFLYDLSKEIRYLEEKNFLDKRNNAYIVYKDNNPIGYISLKGENNKFTISYGLIKEYRGKHLGTQLLREFTSKVLVTYSDIDKLILIIDNKNIGSKKVAINAGYQKESIIRYIKERKI
ncbi:MAG: GNAT family N-acetyltransferase [Candidatus Coprovivens sp.]